MKKIILVDDDSDDAELFLEALTEINPDIQFERFEHTSKALQYVSSADSERPDLIFLDINLPVTNGWELLRELKKTEDYAGIPVVVYTTSSLEREKEIAKDLGAAGYVTKPNDYNEMKKILSFLINNPPAGSNFFRWPVKES